MVGTYMHRYVYS